MSNRRDFLKHLGFHQPPPPMSNTDNTLPEELQKQIEHEADKLYPFDKSKFQPKVYTNGDKADFESQAYIAGATEYAHWKVEANNWEERHDIVEVERNEAKAKLHLVQQEYDKLKMQSELNYEVLMSEYKVLKERADKMAAEHADLNLALAAMLNGYANLSICQKDWFTVPRDLIDQYTKMVLEYNSNTNQNENNG